MPDRMQPWDRDLFDEAGYLRRNPGLIEAIDARIVESAWDHYDKHGRREGRLPNDVDPDFYLRAYPNVERDLGRAPSRGDAALHFIRFGRARGYVPRAAAPRPDHPGAVASRFGGGWTDQADANDRIQDRFDLGRLTDRQADRLRDWVRDGYVVLELGPADDRISPAALAVERAFAGALPGVLFDCPAMAAEPVPFAPEVTPHPAAALDLYHWSAAVRGLLLAPPIAQFLTQLFDSPLLLTGSEAVLRPVAHGPRQDSATRAHTSQRLFAGLWIGLDRPPRDAAPRDASRDALHVYPGSHRFPDFLYGRRYKSVHEARRMIEGGVEEQRVRHAETLMTAIRRRGMERRTLAPAWGSVVIWHPDLVVESTEVPEMAVRRGLRAWVCPRHVAPLYAERYPTRRHAWDGHDFTSGIYLEQDPVD